MSTPRPNANDVFQAWSNPRRRYAVLALDVYESIHYTDLARKVAAAEHETTVDMVDYSKFHSAKMTLYQRHLPTLNDAHIISYDDRSGTCEATDTTRMVADLIRRVYTTFGAAPTQSARPDMGDLL